VTYRNRIGPADSQPGSLPFTIRKPAESPAAVPPYKNSRRCRAEPAQRFPPPLTDRNRIGLADFAARKFSIHHRKAGGIACGGSALQKTLIADH
jgi:hypothetical protein